MEAFLVTVTLLLLLLMVAASTSPAFFASMRAMSRSRESELEMWQMMRRRGLAADGPSLPPGDLARAVRRCTFCPSVDVCHRWLAAQRTEGAEEFCPNIRFFQSLESEQHR